MSKGRRESRVRDDGRRWATMGCEVEKRSNGRGRNDDGRIKQGE